MLNQNPSRRGFFAKLALGGATATVAAVATVTGKPAALLAAPGARPAAPGYRETAHVRNYYRTTQV